MNFGLFRKKFCDVRMTSSHGPNLSKQTTSIGDAYIFGAHNSPKKRLISFIKWILPTQLVRRDFTDRGDKCFLHKNVYYVDK